MGFISLKTNNLIYFYWHLRRIRQGKDVWYEKNKKICSHISFITVSLGVV